MAAWPSAALTVLVAQYTGVDEDSVRMSCSHNPTTFLFNPVFEGFQIKLNGYILAGGRDAFDT